MPDARLDFMKRCAGIPGAALGEGAFSPGPAIWVVKREVAHFDGQHEVDVRLTKDAVRKRRPELRRTSVSSFGPAPLTESEFA